MHRACASAQTLLAVRALVVLVVLMFVVAPSLRAQDATTAYPLPTADAADRYPRIFSRGIFIPAPPAPVVAPPVPVALAQPTPSAPAPVVTDTPVPQPSPAPVPARLPAAETAKAPFEDARLEPLATLSAEDMQLAQEAWRYFAANRHEESGWFNSVDRYEATTMWDLGSALAGLVSANELGLVERAMFDRYMTAFLASLRKVKLYNNELPNREYRLNPVVMTDIGNKVSAAGSGWSALDIGRALTWLRIVGQWYPQHRPAVEEVIRDWKFGRLSANNEMNGALFNGRSEHVRQEGRLGYEQYAAAGYWLWGVKLGRSFEISHTRTVEIMGLSLPADTRNLAFLTSEPFMLASMEFGGWGPQFQMLTRTIYEIQKRRWQRFGAITAVSEEALDKLPWFAYYSIYFDGRPLQSVGNHGAPFPDLRNVSAKAAVAWAAIYPDEYSPVLRGLVARLPKSNRGVYGGLYETGSVNRSLNINTNAVILESLLYLKRGRKPFLELRW